MKRAVRIATTLAVAPLFVAFAVSAFAFTGLAMVLSWRGPGRRSETGR
jgi:hypothetical protein